MVDVDGSDSSVCCPVIDNIYILQKLSGNDGRLCPVVNSDLGSTD